MYYAGLFDDVFCIYEYFPPHYRKKNLNYFLLLLQCTVRVRFIRGPSLQRKTKLTHLEQVWHDSFEEC